VCHGNVCYTGLIVFLLCPSTYWIFKQLDLYPEVLDLTMPTRHSMPTCPRLPYSLSACADHFFRHHLTYHFRPFSYRMSLTTTFAKSWSKRPINLPVYYHSLLAMSLPPICPCGVVVLSSCMSTNHLSSPPSPTSMPLCYS
jgi:hypothetical protein